MQHCFLDGACDSLFPGACDSRSSSRPHARVWGASRATLYLALPTPLRGACRKRGLVARAVQQPTRTAAGSAERSRREPCKKGRGGVASLFADGLWDADLPPPRVMPTLRLGPGPYVRRLSYELRIALAIHEPLHPPSAPASPFEMGVSSRSACTQAGIAIGSEPRLTDFSGGPACSHPHMSRGTSSCPFWCAVRWA